MAAVVWAMTVLFAIHPITPPPHHSTTPPLHHSITPPLQPPPLHPSLPLNKPQPSKLDPHAELLDAWLRPASEGGQGITYTDALQRLDGLGTHSSLSRLSAWWTKHRALQAQDALLEKIGATAEFITKIKSQLAGVDIADELKTLIKLLQRLVFALSAQAEHDPDLLKLANNMLQRVVDYARDQARAAAIAQAAAADERRAAATAADLELRRAALALEERRVKLLEDKAAAADQTKSILESPLSPEEKQARIRAIFGMTS